MSKIFLEDFITLTIKMNMPVIKQSLLTEESLKSYLLFFISQTIKQQQDEAHGRTLSIKDFVKEEYADGQYSDPQVDEETFQYYYDRIHDRFLKLSDKTKKQQKSRGFKARDIYPYQIEEVKSLMDLYMDDKVYKKIRTNKLHNIKFEEYRAFIKKLQSKNYSNAAEQMVDEYKIEKTLGFELIKKILKAKHELNEILLDDLLTLDMLPDIETRHELIDFYVDQLKQFSEHFRKSIYSTAENTKKVADQALGDIPIQIRELPNDVRPSIENYLKGKYINSYTLGKDFEENDFLALMKRIEQLNDTAK